MKKNICFMLIYVILLQCTMVCTVDSKKTSTNIKITGNNGEIIHYIPTVGVITATSVVSGGSGIMALATYSQNGKFKKLEIKEGSNLSLSIYVSKIQPTDHIRIMVFENLTDIKPLVASEILYHSTENTNEFVLTNNTIGGIFKDEAPIKTNAKLEWVTNGTYATDSGFLNDTDKLTDGIIQGENYAKSLDSQALCFANVLIDLNDVYKINKLRLYTYNSVDSKASDIRMLASTDGINFNEICTKEVREFSYPRPCVTDLDINSSMYARFVKVIVSKKATMKSLRIDEIALYGTKVNSKKITPNYTWCIEEPFATSSEILWDNSRLIDGSYDKVAGTNGEYATAIFDLQDCYQVGDIAVFTNGLEGCEAQFSFDGKKYFSTGYRRQNTSGVTGINARYIKLIMNRMNDRWDRWLEIIEVEISVYELYDKNMRLNTVPDRVPLNTTVKNSSTVYFDWSGYNNYANKVDGYSLYISENEFINTKGMMPVKAYETGVATDKVVINEMFCTYMSLSPNKTYYCAVVPIINNIVANENVNVVKIKTPSVLGNEKVGSIFNINEYPTGGSANIPQEGVTANIEKKLKLLSQIDGINNSRWFNHNVNTLAWYASYGINFHLFYNGATLDTDNNLGKWSFSTGNEPEDTFTPEAYAQKICTNYAEIKKKSPNSLLCEPTLMGTEPNKCLKYLDNLYATGANFKDNFDVIDVHPYAKKENGKPNGLPYSGMPELLPQKIADLRGIMKKNNDENKPIIFSEIGWSTFDPKTTDWVMVAQTRENQRDYLVRTYIHAVANNIKQVYWYNFQDEGYNFANREENFGMIDWYGKPKPSYFGYYIMSRILKSSEFVKEIKDLPPLVYAYEFWDEEKNSYITVMWDATGNNNSISLFANKDIMVVGANESLTQYANNATLILSQTPQFIYSDSQLTIKKGELYNE